MGSEDVVDREASFGLPSPLDVAWVGADGALLALSHSSDERYRTLLHVCRPGRTCQVVEPALGGADLVVDPSRPRPG